MSRRAFVTDDGVRIVYEDIGDRAATPIVLCHGLAAAARQFAADAQFLSERGYRVLVPNLRGHGESGKSAAGRVTDYTIARMATDMVQLLDHADVSDVHWVGNSLGGILALWLLQSHSERLRSVATFGTALALNLPPAAARFIPLGYGVLGRHLIAALTAYATTRSPAARRLIRRVLRQFDPAVGYAVAANLVRYDLRTAALNSRVPLLLLRGGRDHNVNWALRGGIAALEGRPGFRLVDLPEGGHCANLDAAEALRRELLAFWGEPTREAIKASARDFPANS